MQVFVFFHLHLLIFEFKQKCVVCNVIKLFFTQDIKNESKIFISPEYFPAESRLSSVRRPAAVMRVFTGCEV